MDTKNSIYNLHKSIMSKSKILHMFIYYFLLLSYIVPQYWIEAIIFYLMLWAAPEFKFNLWSCLPVDATKMRKKYWIQQIYSRLQTIEQLWPSSIYALDTRWWSGNGHLLQNENYHKKLGEKDYALFYSEMLSIKV